jgi:purine-binding chemotaxis protein CheW
VIPVIDMACRLGMKMTEPSERSAIIVTDIAGKLVGLLVEQVSDMMTIKSEDLQPAPEIIPEAQRAFCRGIVALEKTMVCFLNLDTVIADELAQAARQLCLTASGQQAFRYGYAERCASDALAGSLCSGYT